MLKNDICGYGYVRKELDYINRSWIGFFGVKFYEKYVNIIVFLNYLLIKFIYLFGSVSIRFGCFVFDYLCLRCIVFFFKIIFI